MTSDYSSYYPRNGHRIPRPLVLIAGILLGISMGGFAGFKLCEAEKQEAAAVRPWTSDNLECTASRPITGGEVFFVRNSGPDYRLSLPGQFTLMQRTGQGLQGTSAEIRLPVFLPAGETTALILQGSPGDYVVFDSTRRLKLELK